MTDPSQTHATYHEPIEIVWRGITVSIRYCPNWASAYRDTYGHDMAHIELRSGDQPLPVTETGYRSHFIPRPNIEAHGGLEAFVCKWLDETAAETSWVPEQQMSLL